MKKTFSTEIILFFICGIIGCVSLLGCKSLPLDQPGPGEMVVYNRQIERCIVPENPEIQRHDYNLEYLKKKGNFYYALPGANFKVVNGVDVSRHQGKVDFSYLKKKGYEFVILRLGFRRYGYETGFIEKDPNFDTYYADAKAAGLKVGVYIYSQAVNEVEAEEEAEFIIANITPADLDLPVVYDPEFVFWDEARTDNVPEEQFCRNTEVFMDRISRAGFEVMLYSNLMWEVFVFTPEIINKYPIWYAQYSEKPTTPYKFTFWQYSGNARIRGSQKPCDMDVWFIQE